MLPISVELTRDLVLIGGGHTHALVLRMWGMRPIHGVRVTVINPGPTAPYSGMLPGHIAGHYRREDLDIDLVRLARFAGARLIMAPAEAIDPVAKVISVRGRGNIAYDVAALDVGIHAEMPGLEGFAAHGIGAKPLDVYATRWAGFLEQVRAGQARPDCVVIGGGVAGCELAMAMGYALKQAVGRAHVTVIEAGVSLAAQGGAAAGEMQRVMRELGVEANTQARVARVEADAVVLEDGRRIESAFTVGAAGARAHGWLQSCDLPLTEDGFVRVGPDLRVEGRDDLFAVGDCAHLSASPRPKAGVFAVRAAPVLDKNLRAVLTGGPLRDFRPQSDYLKLISLGGKSAVAAKWGRSWAGPAMWRWKDRIDQKFMDKFRNLPEMPVPAIKGARALGGDDGQPLCGGCGSKVAPGALSRALAQVPQAARDDVLTGPGDDAAVLQVGGTRQVITTDHLRGFTEDFGLMARIATVHALGDVWAMGAAPQAAVLSVTLPRMSVALQERSMREILREAGAVLNGEGAEIVGGHSTMGSELSIGLTVTGLLEGAAITNSGARAGDVLVLTRPLGSGVLLAAEMQKRARGGDIAALLQSMAAPQADAAEILQNAHAMTDVTGFGLAGHLMAICRASAVGATIDLSAIPVYAGALEMVNAGVHSTIWAANREAAPVEGADGSRGALLHDPQTAGGLLAAVAADASDEVITRLRAAGHDAAVVGRLVAASPSIKAVE